MPHPDDHDTQRRRDARTEEPRPDPAANERQDDPEPWPVEDSTSGDDHGIFQVQSQRLRSPRTGRNMTRVVLEAPDWVNVVALTDARQLIVVRQFRFGRREVTIEIPGGMVDRGETPLAAGQRELREETGYGDGRWQLLGSVTPNPAFLDNRCWHFLAEDVRRLGDPRPEAGEDIVVDRLSIPETVRAVHRGEIDHALVIAALCRVADLRAVDDTADTATSAAPS